MEYVKQPKTKRGEKTLKKICEAAEELFTHKGYYATEIQDITQKAGIATGTLYVYFPDKASLFLHLMDNLGRKLRKAVRLAKVESAAESFIEQERISARVFFSFVREHFGIFQIVWQSQFVDPESFKLYYDHFSAGYVKEIMKAQDAGEVKDIDPALLSYVLMGIYIFVALKCFVIEEKEPGEDVVEQLVELLSHGILTKSPAGNIIP